MDQRDQELLNKQLWWLNPPSQGRGTMVLAIVAGFCVGLALGGIMFAQQSKPVQTAANDAMASILLPSQTLSRGSNSVL